MWQFSKEKGRRTTLILIVDYAVWASRAPILHIRSECGVLGIVYFLLG